jgi:hypothetical protein
MAGSMRVIAYFRQLRREYSFRMNNLETETSVVEAVWFLSSRVAEQARKDSVSLSDIELMQLSFSEETATPGQIAAARSFDETHNSDEFEERVTRLLRTAFNHDVQRGMRATWERHLAVLRNHDVYVLVIVDQAGISRPKAPARRKVPRPKSPTALIRRSPDIFAGLITLCGFVYFFVLRVGWSRKGPPILGNLTDRLIPSEKVRGIFLVAWLVSMLWLFVRFKDLRD